MGGRDQEGYIVAASAIAYHPDRYGVDRFEEAAKQAGGPGYFVTDNRDDRMVVFYFDRTKRFQFANDIFQLGGIFDRQRYCHFGGSDHVDRGAVFLEDLKDLAKKAVGQEH